MRRTIKVRSDVVGGYWGREISIARRALLSFFKNPNSVYFVGWMYGKSTGKGQYVTCEMLMDCEHQHGVSVSGGIFRVYVPRSDKRCLRISFEKRPHQHEMEIRYWPYRPTLLPLDLWRLTPEYLNGDDPFEGAADWRPAR